MANLIEHEGIITHIYPGHIRVRIVQNSACSGCHAASACTLSDKKEKDIDINTVDTDAYRCGDRVTVGMAATLGKKAVLLSAIYPFCCLFLILLLALYLTGNEIWSGITALASLIPYYIILYLFRNKIKKEFVFTLRR